MIARLQRELFDPRTYGRIGYLLVAGLLGVTEFVFLVTALSIGVGLAITLIGIPILIVSVYAWGGLAEGERRIIAALTGTVIPNPYRPVPEGASRWSRLRARLADPATWKDLTFLLLQFPFGLVAFIVTVVVLSVGIHGVALPLWFWAAPGGVDYGVLRIDQLWEALLMAPVGAVVLLAGIPALSALGRLYTSYAEVLLGSNVDPAVTAQMTDLRDARSRIIEAADAERRRIERDLHDGAQQRLVALALTLRTAERRAEDGGEEVAELVRHAGDEAGLALKELRDLARGIHPAILTNRGLPAALRDLASRATLPVEVVATPDERLPGPVEAAAYFVVSECLANIGKHSNAETATVAVTAHEGHVTVEVSDDGVGGAALDGGSGIQGLADRVGALSGSLAVDSPPGAGTRVTAVMPLDGQPGEPAEQRRPAVPQHVRMRNLRIRLACLGIVAGVLVLIWALTGPELPWIAWPLLGIGLVAGLDAWRVYATPRTRLQQHVGAQVILNVFIIGVWAAAGASEYFWPAWVMVGSAIAVGIHALAGGSRRPATN